MHNILFVNYSVLSSRDTSIPSHHFIPCSTGVYTILSEDRVELLIHLTNILSDPKHLDWQQCDREEVRVIGK
jgi:hypothetical protein